jgi:membrane protein required for beta-lactamase induction
MFMPVSRTASARTPRAKPDAPRVEQVFFDDPAIDRLMGVVMALATEHYVLRDRLRALEEQLAAAGHVDMARLADRAEDPEDVTDHSDAAEFAEELLRPLLGLQQAAGASGRFSLKSRGRGRRRR